MNKKLTILILLLTFTFGVKGQIQLMNVNPSECDHSCDLTKRIYEQDWQSDSILQIKTTASANCIGVHNPRLRMYGPILSLEFDEFEIDTAISEITHNRGEHIVAECICVYQIVWEIKGLKINDRHILLLNGQLESAYNKKNIDDLLRSYQIETHNSTYAFLNDAIDRNGLRQGIQILRENNMMTLKLFIDGKEQTSP